MLRLKLLPFILHNNQNHKKGGCKREEKEFSIGTYILKIQLGGKTLVRSLKWSIQTRKNSTKKRIK